jgi:diguanylate cyclase (GGDEF)-like protein
MRLSPRTWSWVAALGLIGVLAGSAAFEVVTSIESSKQLQDVHAATQLAAAYGNARFDVARTGEAVNRYIADPSPDNRAELDRTWNAALVSGAEVQRLGSPEDIKLINALEDPAKLQGTLRYLENVAAGQDAGVVGPYPGWSTELTTELAGAQQAAEARAQAALANYVSWGDVRTKVSFAGLGIRLLAVVALVFVERALARRNTEAKVEIERLRTIAVSDPLTGLGNRRAFEEACTVTGSEGAPALTFAMIDLDGFKVINDTWGHNRGDTVLRAVADALRDFLPNSARAFRIGGDEFAVILPEVETGEAVDLMDRFRGWVAHELAPASVSIGLVAHPAGETDHVLVRQQADSALYQAKLRGRNVVVLYAASLDSAPIFPASKIQAVHRLLQAGDVRTVFQPIWNLSPRAVFGYEALTRLDPGYDLDGPQEAFDIAALLGQAAELDAICRHSAIAAAASLPPGTLLFLNVAPASLTSSRVSAATLLDELAGIQLDPHRVVVEITERSTLPPPVVAEAARKLRGAGFAIALDDVGAGNIGLAMLQEVPFDYMKIDREIVIGALERGPSRAALRALLAFGAEVGARVLVEGVETEEQMTFVEQMAGWAHSSLIHLVQGYLLGRPVTGFAIPRTEQRAA